MTTTYAVPADRVASRTLDGEAVIINLDSGVYFGLNTSATALWNLLETAPRSVDSLSEALARAHGADARQVDADVRFFVEGLESHGLLIEGGPAAPVESIDARSSYLAPALDRYDTLDELMLSGE
jgi:hypothetical protein